MDRVAAFLGLVGLVAAAGALAVGDAIVVPGLREQHVLLDPNLATSVTGPLHLRCAEVALVGSIIVALAIPRWLGSRMATAAALLVVGTAAVSRLVVLPKVYTAWGKVDLVAQRPVARLGEAQELAGQAMMLDAAIAVLLVVVIGFVAAHRPAHRRVAPAPSPTPEPAPPATPAPAAP